MVFANVRVFLSELFVIVIRSRKAECGSYSFDKANARLEIYSYGSRCFAAMAS